jgi:thioredoxin-dependent peroxiredoxin
MLNPYREIESMRNKKSRTVLLTMLTFAVAAIGILGYRAVHAADNAPAVGTAAPDFTLNSQEGTPISLHDFRGKWVVLYFYPKDFTSGCTMEAHNFQRDLAQYQDKNAVIVGVSVDTADSHKQFCAKEGLNFKLLSDADQKVSEQYGSIMNFGGKKLSARHTFLVSPDGTIKKVYLDVDPSKHSEEVLATLADLQKKNMK